MHRSRINPQYEFNEDKWVVSVLNTTDKVIGHSALMVEGLEKDPLSIYKKPFIGQYDIGTAGEGKESYVNSSCVNSKGYITKIKCFENERNVRNYEELKFPAKSYYVSSVKARAMIASIKQDEIRTNNAMENWRRQTRNETKSELEKEPLILDDEKKPIEPLRFQKFGKDHPLVKLFGDSEAGNNCAGWCLEKLEVAGVAHGNIKPKPKYAAGQCLIL